MFREIVTVVTNAPTIDWTTEQKLDEVKIVQTSQLISLFLFMALERQLKVNKHKPTST
jgi:hypothetical protein